MGLPWQEVTGERRWGGAAAPRGRSEQGGRTLSDGAQQVAWLCRAQHMWPVPPAVHATGGLIKGKGSLPKSSTTASSEGYTLEGYPGQCEPAARWRTSRDEPARVAAPQHARPALACSPHAKHAPQARASRPLWSPGRRRRCWPRRARRRSRWPSCDRREWRHVFGRAPCTSSPVAVDRCLLLVVSALMDAASHHPQAPFCLQVVAQGSAQDESKAAHAASA